MTNKEYKGQIKDWYIFYPAYSFPRPKGSLGYIIRGTFVDHPDFAGEEGSTSFVMSHDRATGEVETYYSRYTLIGEPIREPKYYGIIND